MNLPARFIRGQALTADQLNAIVEAIRRARPLPGAGVFTRESPDGTFISAAAQKQTSTPISAPFSHRWKVTLTTVTDDNGSATHTLHITPGSLWRNDGAGVTDLNVIPDGDTVTTDSDGNWLVENATTGSLYVADNSANQGTSSSGPVYPLIYGDYTKETRPILLRIADLTLASSGVEFVQRQVGDALYSPGGGGGLQLGPLTHETRNGNHHFVRYLGQWVYNATSAVWAFVKAVNSDGSAYPAAEDLPAREMLFRVGGEVYSAYRPDIGPTPTRWLAKHTETIVGGITYSEPQTDADTGALSASELTFTYFTDTAAQESDPATLLYTQVEAANEASHFEA